ncbi:lasso peptide biosynthesis PqqD family chaperone [Bacillus sp. JJ1764]|uniref:lasso peptide biosynthesis PqqD family chaperone n=1 Tax=Bacillus sp. JJ1764 TaxID=3122964 RepID=UPI002FFDDD4A
MISTQTISLASVVLQAEGNVVSDMNGEKVMLSIKSGKYYNLGTIGGEIWQLIKSPIEIMEVVNRLLKDYEIEQKVCEQDVLSFINHLNNEGLIQIVN